MSGVPTDPREGVGPDHLTRQDIQGDRHDYDNAVPRPKVLTPSPSRTPDPMRKVALAGGVTNCGSDAGRRAGVDVPAGSGLVVGINAPLSMMSATATIFGGWEQTTVAGALCALPAAVWEFSFGIYLTFSGLKTAPGSRTSN